MFCLTVASFFLMFLVSTAWTSDLQEQHKQNSIHVVNAIHRDHLFEEDNRLLLSEMLNKIAESSDSSIFILDASGSILLCSDLQKEGEYVCPAHKGLSFSDNTLAEIRNEQEFYRNKGPIDIDSEDIDYFLTASHTEYKGNLFYIILVQQYNKGYQSYITNYIKMVLLAVCVAVVLAFFSSWVATYHIVRPLKKMAEATKHYANGDYSYRIRDMGKFTEFYDLADAFNKMAKQMEVNEESRKNFVANVSHELKTPMTTISGFVDGILDGTIPPEEEAHYLQIVSDVVKHLSGLVVSMLNVSKIEAGKVELNYVELSFDQKIIHTIIGFERIISDKNIDVLGLDKLEEITIRADEALLRQIIYNLIDNAVKFTNDGGALKIELYEEKNRAVFVIDNTGSTIDPDDIANIFDRFYKIDKSRGLDSSSFGLGLSIVRSIVEMHGGTIKATSKENHTRFVIRLPM